jgi:xylulokinase
VNWFRRAFAPNETGDVMKTLNDEMPDRPTNLLFLPHNEPPQWPEFIGDTAGVFVGMKTNTGRGEMFRALLEGITFFFVDAIAAMRRTGICPDSFVASGGSSRSDGWMQMRADILGVPFTRLAVSEGSLTGAAMLAAVNAGLFSSYADAAAAYVAHGRTFTPDAERHAGYREMFGLYKRLYPTLKPLLRDLHQASPE